MGCAILREARPKDPLLVVVRSEKRILRTLSRGEPANSHDNGHPERRIQPFDVLRLRLRTGATLSRGEPANSQEECHPERRITA